MKKFFTALFKLHYLAVLAVIVPFFGAILMLLQGTKDTLDAYLFFFGIEEPEGTIEAGEAALVKLVASVDHFLFAAVLMIFAIGLYTLFFRRSSKVSSNKTPSWNHLKSMGGMDEMLLKVIIMLLAVSLLEFTISTGISNLDWTALVVPAAIIALALGYKWLSAADEEELKNENTTEESTQQNEYLDVLERLTSLHERGGLTDDEFAAEKKRLRE